MKTKFTPGPWRFDTDDMNIYNSIGTGVCTIHRRPKVVGIDNIEESGKSIETLSNARLIAAAPELLEALERVIFHYGPEFSQDTPSIYDEIIIAIHKARGL